MNGAIIGVFLVIIAYLVMMLAIGFIYSKGNNDSSDFYLGGRKLGPFVTAMSAEASDMSSWLLMGLPGVAYLSGICDASWTAIGLAIGTYLNWLIVAKRIRRYSAKTNSITLPDFFANRYRDDSKLLLGISAIFIIIFFVPYTASGFAACGKLFSTLFGIPYTAAMLISAVVIVGYTALGGFMAASFTDLIQSIVMTIALVLVVCFGVSMSGGVSTVLANARELPGFLSLTATYDSAAGAASDYGTISIVSTLAWGLGYFGMPHILLRFMAISHEDKLKTSRRIASICDVQTDRDGMGRNLYGSCDLYRRCRLQPLKEWRDGRVKGLRFGDDHHSGCDTLKPAWIPRNRGCGNHTCRNFSLHDVHRRFPASCGIFRCF